MEVNSCSSLAVNEFPLAGCAVEDWINLFNLDNEDSSELLGQKNLRSCFKEGLLTNKQYAVLKEKERRRTLKLYCAQLSFILPNATMQTHRDKLYEEAITYIIELQEQIKQLTAKKNLLLKMQENQQTSATDSTKVNVFIFYREVSITVNSLRWPRSISKLLQEIENQNMDIEMFQIFSWDSIVSCCFHVFIRDEELMLDQASTIMFLQETLKCVY